MKYKSKFTSQDIMGLFTTDKVTEGELVNTNDHTGVIVFIPFTDQRFFEPIKTRTFQVEVSDEHMDRFEVLINDGFEPWTVTEITETEWIKQFKAQYPLSASAFTQEQLDSFDPRDLIAEYGSAKLEAVKWIKYEYHVGLKEAKDLMDFTYANINFI